MVKCDFVCNIEKLVLELSFEPSDVYPAYTVVENDMTLCPNEGELQFKLYVHLFGRIRRHSGFSSFNCNLFAIHFLYQ